MQCDFIGNVQLDNMVGSDVPAWVFDTEHWCICWANRSGLAFWQAASIDALRQRDFSKDSASVRDRLSIIARTLSEQASYSDIWTLYPNETPAHVLLKFSPVVPGQTRSQLLIEVTERLAAREDVEELRMLEATRATPSIITMMSLDGRILMQNPAALRCYGPAQPTGSEMPDLEVRMGSVRDREQVRSIVCQDKTSHLTSKVQTLQGPKTHAITIQRGRDPVSGDPVILLSEDDISRLSDLYDQQKSEANALQKTVFKSSNRLQRIQERIDRALDVAAIWDWDIEQDKLYFSQNFMALLGYEREEFVAKLRTERFQSILHPQDYIDYQPILADFLKNPDKPISHEMRFVSKSGAYLWIQIEGKCFCNHDGKPVRTAGLLTNITQKKAIEANLLASQKLEAIGKLTGGMAHDFNNLLTIIQGNVQLLEELGTPDRELTAEIIGAVDRGAALTQHLLAFARKQSLHPVPVNIEQLCLNLRATLLRILSETISIVYEGPDDPWDVFADPAQVEAAILNVALNARDAMPTGGTITISNRNLTVRDDAPLGPTALEPGEYVCISISDTGIGMDADTRAKAFDPFFTTKDVGKGTGLGLSMVLGLSEQSGGTTQISSEPGRGATISIFLPRSTQHSAKQVVAAEPVPLVGRGEHVHILEDNAQVNAIMSKMVQSLGYQTTTSCTVSQALSAARQYPDIDVFLVDIILPGGQSGVDFASEVLKFRPDANLILVSGYPKTQLARDVTQVMNFSFLPKPFSRAQISKALAESLSNPHGSR